MSDKYAELRRLADLGAVVRLKPDQLRALFAERDALAAEVDRLRAESAELLAALEVCDSAMDAAALSGVWSLLAPAYRDSWAAAHTATREAIRKAQGGAK